MRLAYFISPHGFGHATRSCAVMAACSRLRPAAAFDLYTGTPRWLFAQSLGQDFPFRHIEVTTDVGLLLVAVKPDKTADYEAVLQALQTAFAASTDPARRAVAQGWRVFKASEADAKGNALYVHVVATPLADADYRPSVVLASLLKEVPVELLVKYRDAFAGPATRLSLSLLTDLALASVAPRGSPILRTSACSTP